MSDSVYDFIYNEQNIIMSILSFTWSAKTKFIFLKVIQSKLGNFDMHVLLGVTVVVCDDEHFCLQFRNMHSAHISDKGMFFSDHCWVLAG